MPQTVFVFCAPFEERIAFSEQADGANLPPLSSGHCWRVLFQTSFTELAIRGFKVDAKQAIAALRTMGFYVGKPGADFLQLRRPPDK